MYNETYYLWEDTSSDQSCHPKESARRFLRLKCACSFHVVPPEQRCLGLGRGLFMGCLKTQGGSHWGQWPGKQWDNALSPVPMNIPADGHSLGLWLFPRPLFEFSVNFKPKSIRCETDVEMLWMGTLWWGGKRELEKHLENAECKDWQQKTRAGNATMRVCPDSGQLMTYLEEGRKCRGHCILEAA